MLDELGWASAHHCVSHVPGLTAVDYEVVLVDVHGVIEAAEMFFGQLVLRAVIGLVAGSLTKALLWLVQAQWILLSARIENVSIRSKNAT